MAKEFHTSNRQKEEVEEGVRMLRQTHFPRGEKSQGKIHQKARDQFLPFPIFQRRAALAHSKPEQINYYTKTEICESFKTFKISFFISIFSSFNSVKVSFPHKQSEAAKP